MCHTSHYIHRQKGSFSHLSWAPERAPHPEADSLHSTPGQVRCPCWVEDPLCNLETRQEQKEKQGWQVQGLSVRVFSPLLSLDIYHYQNLYFYHHWPHCQLILDFDSCPSSEYIYSQLSPTFPHQPPSPHQHMVSHNFSLPDHHVYSLHQKLKICSQSTR
jgi:hypothetical protein